MPQIEHHQTYECAASKDGIAAEYTAGYWVRMSLPTEGAALARVSPGIPRVGDVHPQDRSARVKRVDARDRDGDPYLFDITVTYSNQVSAGSTGDPLTEDPQIIWSAQPRSIKLSYAKPVATFNEPANGAPTNTLPPPFGWIDGSGDVLKRITDSAGFPFDSECEIDYPDLGLEYSRNQTQYDTGFYYPYIGTVNSTSFLGFPAGTAWCSNISGRRLLLRNATGGRYWNVTYNFLFRPDGFGHMQMDAGFHVKTVQGNIGFERFRDAHGEDVTKPCKLNGFGGPLAKPEISGLAAIYLRWATYYGSNFNQLQLNFD